MIYTVRPVMIYRGYNDERAEGMFIGGEWMPIKAFDQLVVMRYMELTKGGKWDKSQAIKQLILSAIKAHGENMGCETLLRMQGKDWLKVATKRSARKRRKRRVSMPINHRQPWSEIDRQYVRDHSKDSNRQIGKALGRRAASIYVMRVKLGVDPAGSRGVE